MFLLLPHPTPADLRPKVTYRTLSRSLKIHVNLAKELLYDFHKSQNAKEPGTVHATYLVYGTRKSPDAHDDDDVEMTDSVSDHDVSIFQAVPTQTLALIREEALQGKSALAHDYVQWLAVLMCYFQRPCSNMKRSSLFMSTVWHCIT